jgi:Uma2 family endonuclease
MMTALGTPTLADLLRNLGGISPDRVMAEPAPGTAMAADVERAHGRERRLCELVDGTLVEKPKAYRESRLAMFIGRMLGHFVDPRNLGLVTGPDGMMEIFAGLVRIPDVAYASWARIPGGRMPTAPIPELVPDLVVEVLGESNTPAEMARKRREYFTAGVCLVWEIDPDPRTANVYTEPENPTPRTAADVLEGGTVLPGFVLPLREVFAGLDRRAG